MSQWEERQQYWANWDDQEFLNGAFYLSACQKCGALVGQGMQQKHLDFHEKLVTAVTE